MMESFKDNSLIYPTHYDELAKKRAAVQLRLAQQAELQAAQENELLRTQLFENIARPADATVRGLGDLAIQSITGGILQPTYDTDLHQHETTPATPEQTLALGSVCLRDYMLRDTTSTMVTDAAVLGYANRQAA